MLRYSRGILLVPAILLLVTCHSNPGATHPTERAAGHVTRPTNTTGTHDYKPCWFIELPAFFQKTNRYNESSADVEMVLSVTRSLRAKELLDTNR
jgi:hypothetical protein